MVHVLFAGIGGFLGSIARYWLSGLAQKLLPVGFPVGTLLVNLLGCFAMGVVMSLVEYRSQLSSEWRVFLTVGILGGFTTFSAFGYETCALISQRQMMAALVNVLANVLFGVGAVMLGWVIAKAFAG